MSEWMRPFLAGAAVIALLALSVGMVSQAQRANEAEERAEELEAEVVALRAEVERLETQLEDDASGVEAAIGELLGGPAGRMLGEMLSDGELERLLSGLLGDRDPGGLLDDLLGDRELDDLLGGRSLGDLLGRSNDGSTDPADVDAPGGLLGDDVGDVLAAGVPGAACLSGGTAGGLGDLIGGGGAALPDEPEALVEVVAGHVADLRELDWSTDVEVDFVDGAELSGRLDELLDEADPARELDGEQRLLSALGAIPADTDLEQLQREMLDGQVAGYYAPEDGELVVRVPDDGTIRPLDKVTLAHELDHALADQALGLPELDGPPFDEDADAALGALAVIEGDATLLMQLWSAEHLSLADQLVGLLGADAAGAQAQFATVPYHLQQELLFPYTAGLEYVCQLQQRGGWEAVDAAYEQPPSTSLEVLHPDLQGFSPDTPPELAAPSDGEEVLATTFGAAPLQWLFEAPGGDPARGLDDPPARAAAWGGGEARVWELGDDGAALGLSLVDRGEGPGLCDSVTAWHTAAFPGQQRATATDTAWFRGAGPEAETVTAVRCDDETVRYVASPDLGTTMTVLGG
jgi:hypothetical protein